MYWTGRLVQADTFNPHQSRPLLTLPRMTSTSANAPTSSTSTPGLQRFAELAAAEPLQLPCDAFYFLRHGQTPCNARRIFQTYEEPLSELGEQQASAAAAALAQSPIRQIIASDARRAVQTAQAVAAALRLQPSYHAGLRERHFGALMGTSSAQIDWDCTPEGGETLAQFVNRKRQALQLALDAAGPVLVVAHGGSLYVLAALLHVPLDSTLLANAQPLHFTRGEHGWQARALCATSPMALASSALA